MGKDQQKSKIHLTKNERTTMQLLCRLSAVLLPDLVGQRHNGHTYTQSMVDQLRDNVASIEAKLVKP